MMGVGTGEVSLERPGQSTDLGKSFISAIYSGLLGKPLYFSRLSSPHLPNRSRNSRSFIAPL